MFKLIKKSKKSSARLGSLKTAHGIIQTPFFMPIATKGAVKSLTTDEMKKIGSQIILSNTYHLYLQPGMNVIKKFKGLHNFMNWSGPILTDSGGYQVFSLGSKNRKYYTKNALLSHFSIAKNKYGKQEPTMKQFNNVTMNEMVKINRKGVEFRSYLNGSKHLFTPEKVQQIQGQIGSDIKMVLDMCSPHPCSRAQAERDLEMTHDWALRSLKKHLSTKALNHTSLLFGIVQGSTFKNLRLKSVKFLRNLNFDGLAIGGLAVGESAEKMYKVLDYVMPEMPVNKPRYLMGVGKPENIIQAVKYGVDMFDCVIPTREARHGRLYIRSSNFESRITKKDFYEIINITNSKYKNSTKKLDENCECEVCQKYTLGYLHHLFKSGELLGIRLASLHNVKFYLDLMKEIRIQIKTGKL